MGHHSVAFTMDQYADAWPEQIASAGEAAARLLLPSGSKTVAAGQRRDAPELQGRYVQAAVPERQQQQGQLDAMLDSLPVKWAVDISKGLGATKACVYRYRGRKGGSFVIRELKPGWSRVWRIA